MRCSNTKHYFHIMPFLDFNSRYILILEDLWWFWAKSLLTWIHFTEKLVKKFQKKLVKSLLAQHKSQQDWSFERVPTCKLSNVKVVCLQRAGAKNARYSAQLSVPHRSKIKFPPKIKSRKKTGKLSGHNTYVWQILNKKRIKSSEICIKVFWTFVKSLKTESSLLFFDGF